MKEELDRTYNLIIDCTLMSSAPLSHGKLTSVKIPEVESRTRFFPFVMFFS